MAAHCVHELATPIEVVTASGQVVETTDLAVHPDFNEISNEADLALVYLPEPAAIDDAVQAAELAETEPPAGDYVTDLMLSECSVLEDSSMLPDEDPATFCVSGEFCGRSRGPFMAGSDGGSIVGIVNYAAVTSPIACASSVPGHYDWLIENVR